VKTPCFCLIELCLWSQHQDAVFNSSQCGSCPYLFMERAKKQMSWWLMPIQAYTTSRAPGWGFLPLRPMGPAGYGLFLFTKAILEGRPINVFNYGDMKRDFTYIDDIIEGVVRVVDRIPEPTPGWGGEIADPGTSYAPYKVYNIGNNNPVELTRFIEILENCLGKKAEKNLLPMQAGGCCCHVCGCRRFDKGDRL